MTNNQRLSMTARRQKGLQDGAVTKTELKAEMKKAFDEGTTRTGKNIPARITFTDSSSDNDRSIALMKKFGSGIRQARIELGLNQDEVAYKAKVSPEYISVIEHGKQIPSEPVLLAIAETLKDAGITYQGLLFQAMEIQHPEFALHLDEREYAEELEGLDAIQNSELREALRRVVAQVGHGILNQAQSEKLAKGITRTFLQVIGENPADEVDDRHLQVR